MKLISMTDFVLEQEKEWKPVFGFEGYYEVSDIGRCRSVERDIIYNNDEKTRKGVWKGKILKPTLKEDGYLRYNLSKEGKITRILAHRMVALAFLQNPENKRVVNHKDSIRHNNVLNNLEWATDSENVLHSYKKGNRKEKFYGHCCIKKDIKLDILISLKTFVLNL
nr:NUMOD4 domain-containing protein [uncultured Flavobacterium sp.]